jgi:hypothetical protein
MTTWGPDPPRQHGRQRIESVISRPSINGDGPAQSGARLQFLYIVVTVAAALTGLGACDRNGAGQTQAAAADATGVEPGAVSIVALRASPDLTENSAAAASASQPSVIFTINDSGNEAILYAFDTTGMGRGAWRVINAVNKDWEDVSFGPCAGDALAAPGPAPDPGGSNAGVARQEAPLSRRCVYIGDTGDNSEIRDRPSIYRMAEPAAQQSGYMGELTAERIGLHYADGPHDVEAMYVAPDGAIWLITKRPRFDASGHLRPALVFRIAPEAWTTPGTVTVATLVDSLPLVPGSAPLRYVTDAALSPDAQALAVRTYGQVFVYPIDSATGRILRTPAASRCNIAQLHERQGEGITWLDSSGRLLLTSEGGSEPIRLITCPMPR